jgi:hypothetical protein
VSGGSLYFYNGERIGSAVCYSQRGRKEKDTSFLPVNQRFAGAQSAHAFSMKSSAAPIKNPLDSFQLC